MDNKIRYELINYVAPIGLIHLYVFCEVTPTNKINVRPCYLLYYFLGTQYIPPVWGPLNFYKNLESKGFQEDLSAENL